LLLTSDSDTLLNVDFEDYSKKLIPKIETQVDQILSGWKSDFLKKCPQLKELAEVFIKAHEGGKRVRGVLVILGYEIFGGKKMEEILKVSAAFEIFHTSILAQDDIIDKSVLRRGKPTIYSSLGFDHYALSQTICLSDLGLFLAVKVITECGFEEKPKNLAITEFSRIMHDTALGELLDVELPSKKQFQDEKGVEMISLLKTAQYTVTGPLKVGAILAVTQEKLDALEEFGDNLGIAFQIQDDILGAFGDSEEMGKSNISDFAEGKVTFLSAYAFKKCALREKEMLMNLYGKSNLSEVEAGVIKSIFKEGGALDYAKARAVEYSDSAKKAIPKITKDKIYQAYFYELVEYLVKRNK
jgi:geranylgeranyl pyrophosphate synthase